MTPRLPLLVFALLVTCAAMVPSASAAEQRNGAVASLPVIVETGDRTIVPGYRVGPIKVDTTETQLIQLFGGSSLLRARHLADGEPKELVTRLMAGGWATLSIHWRDDFKTIRYIRISGKYVPWKTREGVTIGTTLKQLERLNGRAFQIYGLAWHHGGLVASWNNGRLPETLKVRLVPTRQVSDRQHWKVMGDAIYSSRHWAFRNMAMQVESLFIMLERNKSSAQNR